MFGKNGNIQNLVSRTLSRSQQRGLNDQIQNVAAQAVQRLGTMLPQTDRMLGHSGKTLGSILTRLQQQRGLAPQAQKIPIAMADGGRAGTALNALRALAARFQAALESGDTGLAGRIARQMESIAPGSSREVMDSLEGMEDKVANDKAGML